MIADFAWFLCTTLPGSVQFFISFLPFLFPLHSPPFINFLVFPILVPQIPGPTTNRSKGQNSPFWLQNVSHQTLAPPSFLTLVLPELTPPGPLAVALRHLLPPALSFRNCLPELVVFPPRATHTHLSSSPVKVKKDSQRRNSKGTSSHPCSVRKMQPVVTAICLSLLWNLPLPLPAVTALVAGVSP